MEAALAGSSWISSKRGGSCRDAAACGTLLRRYVVAVG